MLRTSQSTLIKTEKEFSFPSDTEAEEAEEAEDAEKDELMEQEQEQEQDAKPTVNTTYKALSVYPFQLLVSVDDELFVTNTNTLDSYFQIL
jgi:hypothetical protein